MINILFVYVTYTNFLLLYDKILKVHITIYTYYYEQSWEWVKKTKVVLFVVKTQRLIV